jgi:hypothetical protein
MTKDIVFSFVSCIAFKHEWCTMKLTDLNLNCSPSSSCSLGVISKMPLWINYEWLIFIYNLLMCFKILTKSCMDVHRNSILWMKTSFFSIWWIQLTGLSILTWSIYFNSWMINSNSYTRCILIDPVLKLTRKVCLWKSFTINGFIHIVLKVWDLPYRKRSKWQVLDDLKTSEAAPHFHYALVQDNENLNYRNLKTFSLILKNFKLQLWQDFWKVHKWIINALIHSFSSD